MTMTTNMAPLGKIVIIKEKQRCFNDDGCEAAKYGWRIIFEGNQQSEFIHLTTSSYLTLTLLLWLCHNVISLELLFTLPG